MIRSVLSILFLYLFTTAYSQLTVVEDVDSRAFNKLLIKQQYTVVDIRTDHEFKSGHIAGAKNINFYSFRFMNSMELIPKDVPIMIYCNTGYRSRIAANRLKKRGYVKVYNLENGIMEWDLVGYGVVVSGDYVADNTHKVSYSEFNQITGSETLTLVDFYAPWCAPCKEMMPIIDSISNDYRHYLSVVKVNADVSRKLIKRLGISSVPCFRLYSDGVMLYEVYGKMSKSDLYKVIDRYKGSEGVK